MTARELKKLSRMELLQLLLLQTQETERLKNENESLKEHLNQRTIQVTEAGNIAEASMKINKVMEAAQEAAQQYLDNIQTMETQTRQRCREMEARTLQECEALKAQTELLCAGMEEATQRKCDELTGKALAKARNTQKTPNRKKGRR